MQRCVAPLKDGKIRSWGEKQQHDNLGGLTARVPDC